MIFQKEEKDTQAATSFAIGYNSKFFAIMPIVKRFFLCTFSISIVSELFTLLAFARSVMPRFSIFSICSALTLFEVSALLAFGNLLCLYLSFLLYLRFLYLLYQNLSFLLY